MAIQEEMRILVVDDFQPMRNSIVDALKLLDFTNITEAGDGSSALEKIQNETIGLVILDWTMPAMTGLEVLKVIRSDDKSKDLPVIMVTAEAKPENIMKAIKAGVNDYIVKPLNVRTLLEKIEKIFG